MQNTAELRVLWGGVDGKDPQGQGCGRWVWWTCVARTLRDVARWVEVDARVDIWRKDEGGGALLESADFVIDAIDNIQTKVDLLHYCHTNKIPVFSMGGGAKTDPTRIHIADISNTIYDPLARAVRRRLRLLGVSSGIPVVYSTEVPGDVKLLPLPEDEFAKGKVAEADWRVRVLPVLGPLPAVFGECGDVHARRARGEADTESVGREEPEEGAGGQEAGGEPGIVTEAAAYPSTRRHCAHLRIDDIHRGRSVIPPHPVPVRPTLVRWNLSEGLTLENIVVMEQKEAAKHEAGVYGYVGDTKTESGLDLWARRRTRWCKSVGKRRGGSRSGLIGSS
ncbi:hypothetical protein C8F01DRAFT_1232347 [Mycena amicta]|nr:hypothetical protein C8F01DRAFT_1232347 [Mycena amicta]